MPRVALVFEQKAESCSDQKVRDLKHRLSDAGITQAELGKKLGMDQRTISYHFSNGKRMSLLVLTAAEMMIEGKI